MRIASLAARATAWHGGRWADQPREAFAGIRAGLVQAFLVCRAVAHRSIAIARGRQRRKQVAVSPIASLLGSCGVRIARVVSQLADLRPRRCRSGARGRRAIIVGVAGLETDRLGAVLSADSAADAVVGLIGRSGVRDGAGLADRTRLPGRRSAAAHHAARTHRPPGPDHPTTAQTPARATATPAGRSAVTAASRRRIRHRRPVDADGTHAGEPVRTRLGRRRGAGQATRLNVRLVTVSHQGDDRGQAQRREAPRS